MINFLCVVCKEGDRENDPLIPFMPKRQKTLDGSYDLAEYRWSHYGCWLDATKDKPWRKKDKPVAPRILTGSAVSPADEK